MAGHLEAGFEYARQCLEKTRANSEGLADHDLFNAQGGIARALAAARRLAAEVADVADRPIVEGDRASGHWFGLEPSAPAAG